MTYSSSQVAQAALGAASAAAAEANRRAAAAQQHDDDLALCRIELQLAQLAEEEAQVALELTLLGALLDGEGTADGGGDGCVGIVAEG